MREGFQFPVGKESATVISSMVDEFYFDTMGLTILRGRAFTAKDGADAPRVAVVNEQLAQHYWPGQDPLGRRFRVDNARGPWVEIVGLAKNSKYIFIAEPPTECVYLPYRQKPQRSMTLLAGLTGDVERDPVALALVALAVLAVTFAAASFRRAAPRASTRCRHCGTNRTVTAAPPLRSEGGSKGLLISRSLER